MPTYYIRETRTTEMLVIVEATNTEEAIEKHVRQDTVAETVVQDRVEALKVLTLDGSVFCVLPE